MPQLTEKTLSWIVKGGLLLVPLIPLLITKSMYFPFITGKNFAFRILIEILAFFWVWLMLVAPRYRPKLSLITIAYSAFTAVLILATLFGLSPYKSFWSSYERMEGLFGHLHLFLLFIMLGSVFVRERDWQKFFLVSIGTSAVVSFYAVLQLLGKLVIHQGGVRVDATLGNATYLGVYLLFHVFLIAIFFLRSEKAWQKVLFASLFIFEAIILYYSASRGPLIGFLVGAALFLFLLILFQRGRLRQIAVGALIALALIPIVFFFAKNTNFIRSNDVFARFVDVTKDAAIQGRFVIWNMALRGSQERPILGWGQESFVYIFSKYYEPSLWRNEPWFDRAHNVFLDWLTASGVLGLGAYLTMFAAALWSLGAAFRRGGIDRYIFAGFSAVLVAHFLQNMFVFDNITSYLLFFSVLAYVHSVSLPLLHREEVMSTASSLSPFKIGFLGFLAVVIGYSVVMWNIQPMRTAASIIDALIVSANPNPAGKVDALIAELKKGIRFNTFGTTELREQANQVGSNILQDPGIVSQEKGKYLAFVIEETEKQRREQPYDVRAMAFIANAYSAVGRFDDVIATVNEALKISNKRQQFYFIAAEAYLNNRQPDSSIQALQTAYELDTQYNEAVHNLAVVLIVTRRISEADALLKKHFGTIFPASRRYAAAYGQIGDMEKVVKVWEVLVNSNLPNAEYHAELGSAYFKIGKKQQAIAEFQKAIEIEPQFKTRGEEIIQQIRNTP